MRRELCESCGGKPAEFSVSRVSKTGRRGERSLCESCARDSERVLFGDSGLLLTDMLKTLVMARSSSESGGNRTKVCPNCGNTVGEVKEAGIVGCSMCFMVFRDEIDRVIEELHGSGKPA